MVCDVKVVNAASCNDGLVFLQAVALKSPQVITAPLLLQEDKSATSRFCQW